MKVLCRWECSRLCYDGIACCRHFEREKFQALCKEVAFVGPQVTQCIKLMSGQSDLTEISLFSSNVLWPNVSTTRDDLSLSK